MGFLKESSLLGAMLEDIRCHPEDDTPRLILADWLQDHADELGAARGRLLRDQCIAASLPEGQPERIEHERMALECLLAYQNQWLGPLAAELQGWTYTRGRLWIETSFHAVVDLLGHAHSRDLCWIEGLALLGRDGWERLQPDHPILPFLTGLNLSGSLLGPERLHALLSRFPAGQLRHLDLSYNELDDEALASLLQLPALSRLTQLELRHNHLRAATLQRLPDAPCWHYLRSLNLRDNAIGPEGIALLKRTAPPALLALGLASCKIRTVHGLALLLSTPIFPHLRELDLSHTGLGSAGMEELARYKGPTRLQRLNLEVNRLEDAALAHLVRAQVLAGVEVLSLADNPVSEAGAEMLATSPYLGRVAWLSLDHSHLGVRGMRALLRSECLASLHRLDVTRALLPSRGELDDLTRDEIRVPLTTLNMTGVQLAAWSLRGVYALLESLRLRRLDVSRNQLGPASCPWLTDCAGLRDIMHLGLAGNNLRGLEALTRSQVLRNLRSLDLSGVPLGDAEGLSLSKCTNWPQRIRLFASPLGLSNPILEKLHERYDRLDAHGINTPRWISPGRDQPVWKPLTSK